MKTDCEFTLKKVLRSHENWQSIDKEILEAYRYNRSTKEFVSSVSCVKDMFFLDDFSADLTKIFIEKFSKDKDYFILIFAIGSALYYTTSEMNYNFDLKNRIEVCWHEIGVVYSDKELFSEGSQNYIFVKDEDNFELFLED